MSWETTKLGDVLTIQNGYAFDSKSFSNSDGTPLIRIRDLKNGVETKTNYNGMYDDKFLVNAGDLLIGMDGEFGCFEWKGKPSLLNQRVCRLMDFSNQLLPRFLFYGINQYLKEIESKTVFITVKHISSKQIKDIPFPIPPLPVQKQIVEKLDAAFADIDKAISATEKNIENAEALFQSSLIKIFKNPEFKYLELEKVCNIIGGGTPSKKNKSFYEGEIPWATVRDMKNDFIHNTEFKITDDAIKKSSTNLIPGGNVVIATRVGLGKVSIISCDTGINQDLKGIIPKREGLLDINFLFFWFKSISKVIIDAGTGATVQGVKLPFVKSLRIPNIDISLQRQLSSNIEQISEQKELLVSIYNQKLNHLTGLKFSLINQALSGELTKDVA